MVSSVVYLQLRQITLKNLGPAAEAEVISQAQEAASQLQEEIFILE